MKHKKIVALTLVLTLLVGIFAMVPSVGAVSDNPVNLIYAKPAYTSTGISATGYIGVKNIAYNNNKNITIYYSFDGEEWYNCVPAYCSLTWKNYEVWRFETAGKTPGYKGTVTVQFTIKYEVDGQTYWDNNNGKSYSVTAGYNITDCFAFGIGGIANFYANKHGNSVNGALQLKNLGYEEGIRITYTTDNWVTINEINAEYGYTLDKNNSIELWYYTIPMSSNSIQYKLSYTTNGITYVDDNFGYYYTV